MKSHYNPNKELLEVIEKLIDIQWNSKECQYDYYEKMINDLRTKLVHEDKEVRPVK